MSQVLIYDANAYLRQSLNRHDPLASLSPRFVYEATMASPYPNIWVWDGARNNDRRRAIFAGYKIRDYTGQEDIFAGLRVYRDLLTCSTATQIEVPEWEADDVCATLARHFAKQGVRSVIHTNDFDFQQLLVNTHITLKGVRTDPDVPHHLVPLYKALRGDKSDKIPGIEGFGPKSWLNMKGIWEELDRAMREKDIEFIRAQPFTPKVRLWLASDENVALLFAYYEITRMWDVPLDLIEKHTMPGRPDVAAAQQLFTRFML